jgi:hypothetical protein
MPTFAGTETEVYCRPLSALDGLIGQVRTQSRRRYGRSRMAITENADNAPEDLPWAGTSPYATGGGGVTFERKVAVQYLAHMLSGDTAVELGNDRQVVTVAFQQDPAHPVDDLVVSAARVDEQEPSLVLSVAVRRAPNLVLSDDKATKLIKDFVAALIGAPAQGPQQLFALIVAGSQEQAKQLAELTSVARVQASPSAFFDLVQTRGKFDAGVRGRLTHVTKLVQEALGTLSAPAPGAGVAETRTWDLLHKLTVLMPRLEPPDESDWGAILNSLIPVARDLNLPGAVRLRDRLVALVADYPTRAATIDLTILRRDTHTAIHTLATRRHQQGWRAIDHLDQRAISSVSQAIVSSDGARRVHIDRGAFVTTAIDSATKSKAVLVTGESGVGKSAVVLAACTSTPEGSEDRQVLRVNLRHLPRTTLEFVSLLGTPLESLLAELSAPIRMLVIDGADAVSEGMLEPFQYLLDSARVADMCVLALAANESRQIVHDTMADRLGKNVIECLMPGLTDAQIDEVVATFGELANLAANSRARELLRRPVVIDLFIRSGVYGLPLSEADAMQLVWRGLVRKGEQAHRGTPESRDLAMLKLAELAVSGGDPLATIGAIDPVALEGLRQDGLLRRPDDDPFRIGPEFAHDELRRYAIARLFLGDSSLTAGLIKSGVPRWTLGAARIASQVRLTAPDTAANPLRGRFARVQAAFDALVKAGYGDRWGDVPGEALLTLGDPDPLLRDAWEQLRGDRNRDLERLCRLVDQRLRDGNGILRLAPVEPVIKLLLEDATPWRIGEYVPDILRDWLRAHVLANTPIGYDLRIRLGDRLVAACAAGDQRIEMERAARAAARAALSPEELKKSLDAAKRNRALFAEVGHPRRRARQRSEVPIEIKDKVVVELLALLGPDLGPSGEGVLRRIGQDAPSWLAPAVEEPLTGRALAMYHKGFLAELTELYYIDREEDGSGLLGEGIRGHRSRGFGTFTPLAIWYRGPFMPLFQTDFSNAVQVLNRILDHAAAARVRTLAGLDRYGQQITNTDIDRYRSSLALTGAPRSYLGDSHVWLWYRGTGVGPYPCMSALQALERVCDQLIQFGVPLSTIVDILLNDCNNLAMAGLVVGLIVRHLQHAERLIDPILADPIVWRYEFERIGGERSGLQANSEGVTGADRRHWSLREVAGFLVARANEARLIELRAIGRQLVGNAKSLIRASLEENEKPDEASLDEQVVLVRAWASALDSDTYQTTKTDSGYYIQSQLPADVVAALKDDNEDLRRVGEAARLTVRYHVEPNKQTARAITATELASDLAIARDLVDRPPSRSIGNVWDAPTAVAATAIFEHVVHGTVLPDELLGSAVDILLHVGAGDPGADRWEPPDSFYEQGADRTAARVLPLLLLPSAERVLNAVDALSRSSVSARLVAASHSIARSRSQEVRLHLARGLDRVWQEQCGATNNCHHQIAFDLTLDAMRDTVFGEWDAARGRREILDLSDPIEVSLEAASDKAISFSRLDAGLRALAPAVVAGNCVSQRAHTVFEVALRAQRRALLAYDNQVDSRGTHALVSARALLTLASNGYEPMLFEHLDGIVSNAGVLVTFLRALSAAAEESPVRAAAARHLWPKIMSRVLALWASGQSQLKDGYSSRSVVAELLPNTAGEVAYLYRELESDPITWWDPLAWRDVIEGWLSFAMGDPSSVDQLIGFLSSLPRAEQVRTGLTWMSQLVLPDPTEVGARSYLIATWLIECRACAMDQGLQGEWQRIVDALVVAGVNRLAPYSE